MLSSQFREEIQAFVDGRESASEFEDWFLPQIGQLVGPSGTADALAVTKIELGLVEIGQGILTEDELRAEMAELLERNEAVMVGTTAVTTSGSATKQTTSFMVLETTVRSSVQLVGWGPQ